MGIWSLLLSVKGAQATLRKTVSVVRQVRSTIENASAAELQDLRRRAESGDRLAQYDLAETYYTGAGAPQDFAEAARWFELSARSGYVKSQVTLSMLYAAGRGVERDFTRALFWIEQAAATRDAAALRFRSKLLAKMSAEQIAAARRLIDAWNTER
ncbi:MAG: sel1 repeat family protein [Verrucomicrobia bacterium]|nr:sel1 repeat family protein [Verrucomicrobiota bacterium]